MQKSKKFFAAALAVSALLSGMNVQAADLPNLSKQAVLQWVDEEGDQKGHTVIHSGADNGKGYYTNDGTIQLQASTVQIGVGDSAASFNAADVNNFRTLYTNFSGINAETLKDNADLLAKYKAAGIVPGTVDKGTDGAVYGIAIGNSSHSASNGVAMGNEADAVTNGSVAIGGLSKAGTGSNNQTTAIGWNAQAVKAGSVALGANSVANESNVVSVGKKGGERKIVNVADGTFAKDSHDAVTAGQLYAAGIVPGKADVSNDGKVYGLAIGNYSHSASNGVALGTNADATNGSVAIGMKAQAGDKNSRNNAAAIGREATALAGNSVAFGAYSKVTDQAHDAVALGSYSVADEANTISVGKAGSERRIVNVAAGTKANDAVTVGQLADANDKATAGLVKWDKDADGNVTSAIKGVSFDGNGAFSTTVQVKDSNTLAGYSPSTLSFNENGFTVSNTTFGGTYATTINGGTVTTKKVTGLAAGVADSDAVNVKQLGDKAEELTNEYKAADTKLSESITEVGTEAKKHTTLTEKTGNLNVVKTDKDGQANYDVSLSNHVTLSKDNNKVDLNGDAGTISVKNNSGVFGVDLTSSTMDFNKDGLTVGQSVGVEGLMATANSTNIKGGTITAKGTLDKTVNVLGKDYGIYDRTEVSGGDITSTTERYEVKTSILGFKGIEKETHKFDVSNKGVTFTKEESRIGLDGLKPVNETTTSSTNIDGGTVTFSDNKGQIHGLAAGTADNDAVNVSQLKKVNEEAGKKTSVSAGKNITVDHEEGSLDYKVNLADDITVKSVTADTISAANGKFNVAVDGTVISQTGTSQLYIAGDVASLSNGGASVTVGGAPNTVTLSGGINGGSSLTINRKGTTIAGGLDVSGSKITGVKAGEADTDVVNVKQLNDTVTTATEGSVKWDSGTTDTIHGVKLNDGVVTADSAKLGGYQLLNGAIISDNGAFVVGPDGSIEAANGQFSVLTDGTVKTKKITGLNNAVLDSNAADYDATAAVNVGTLKTAVSTMTGMDVNLGNVVQYDKQGNLYVTQGNNALGVDNYGARLVSTNEKNGVGNTATIETSNGSASMTVSTIKEDGTAVNHGVSVNADGSASLSGVSGNGFTANTNGTNTINGNTDINGSLNVNGNFSVNGKNIVTTDDLDKVSGTLNDLDAYAGKKDDLKVTDANGDKVNSLTGAVNANFDKINANTQSIDKINTNIGATGKDGKVNLTNRADTIEKGINQNTADILQNQNAINSLGRSVNKLGGEIDSVGAISAALAGLHPIDYDPTQSKYQLSAALGSYDGSSALALGGFYNFNEDVLLSLGVSTALKGERKTAGNLGVTFRIGAGAEKKAVPEADKDILTRIAELAQKVSVLEQKNDKLEQENADQKKQIEVLQAKTF